MMEYNSMQICIQFCLIDYYMKTNCHVKTSEKGGGTGGMHSCHGVRPIQTPADWKLPTLPN